jgi:hypothetical protein
MAVVNRRGGASIAALGFAAVIAAAVMTLALRAREDHRRAERALAGSRARVRLLRQVLDDRARVDASGTERETTYADHRPGHPLRVTVGWKKVGGRWLATSWQEDEE